MMHARGGPGRDRQSSNGSNYDLPASLLDSRPTFPFPLPILQLKHAIDRAVERSIALVPSEALATEIGNHLKYKFNRRAYSRATVEGKAVTLQAFRETLKKDCKLADITTEDVQRYYDDNLRNSSPVSAYKRLMDVRAFLNWALVHRKILQNPALEIRVECRPHSSRIRYCSRGLRDRLIEECPKDLKLVLMLGFHAGLRKNEIIQAVPNWFNLNLGFIDLHDTPSIRFTSMKRGRTVPMTHELKKFLLAYGLPAPFLLRPDVPQRQTYYRFNFAKPFRRYMKAQGVEWVTPHVMRHTFASLLAIDGKSIYKIAAWLGDTVRVTESVYAHLSPQDEDVNLS